MALDINYFPATPGGNPAGSQQMAANWFQSNPQAMQSGIGPALTGGSLGNIGGTGTGIGSLGSNSGGLGFNMGTANLALSGISTIGNLWAAFQAQKLAKEQFNFQKGITNTNLANQIQSYNTALTDRITSRSFTQGDGQAVTDKYLADNALRDERNQK